MLCAGTCLTAGRGVISQTEHALALRRGCRPLACLRLRFHIPWESALLMRCLNGVIDLRAGEPLLARRRACRGRIAREHRAEMAHFGLEQLGLSRCLLKLPAMLPELTEGSKPP